MIKDINSPKEAASKEIIDALDIMTTIKVEIYQLIKKIQSLPETIEKRIIIDNFKSAEFWVKKDIENNHKL